MNILLIGAGGREQALAWKLEQSPRVEKVFIAPGNGGTKEPCENLAIGALEIGKLRNFALEKKIGLTVVGPDDALAQGIVDEFEEAGLRIFGPNQSAARFESSKSFAKEFMLRHGIPTAESRSFTDCSAALDWCSRAKYPLVVKADGLALGKGVVIAANLEEAANAVRGCMEEKIFGEAGATVVLEEFLEGSECSIHAFVDGESYLLCPDAKDHKRAFEKDLGPNTGGMGTISPSGLLDDAMLLRVRSEILDRFLAGIKEERLAFRGLLFPGVMLTASGPKVLEFNCRFGDPETQVLMRRLDSDLLDVLESTIEGRLGGCSPRWKKDAAACITIASGGYPGSYEKGKRISGILEAEQDETVRVFHAGTACNESGLVSSGGRVLSVTATGTDISHARRSAYSAVSKIHFDGSFFRRDIGGSPLQP